MNEREGLIKVIAQREVELQALKVRLLELDNEAMAAAIAREKAAAAGGSK